MESPHLDEELVERFLSCKATRHESRIVVGHLLHGCPGCSAKLLRLWQPVPDAAYLSSLEHIVETWTAKVGT